MFININGQNYKLAYTQGKRKKKIRKKGKQNTIIIILTKKQ